jgi:cellulose synthase/poly-beta-1,6-N-acetylglucosamine synthase-like glycosyltransferase
METIFVGIPVLESFKAHTVDSLLHLMDYWRANPIFRLTYSIIIGSRQIHFSRNALVHAGLDSGANYICFIDADMTFPPDTLHRLYFNSKDIVGVLYSGRIKPNPPNIFYFNKDKELIQADKVDRTCELIEVDAVGTGFMLIRRKVFEELPTPWFFYEKDKSEDIMFCREARKHGYKIYVNTTLNIGHIGDHIFYLEDNK